jgi:hypothetical protein
MPARPDYATALGDWPAKIAKVGQGESTYDEIKGI